MEEFDCPQCGIPAPVRLLPIASAHGMTLRNEWTCCRTCGEWMTKRGNDELQAVSEAVSRAQGRLRET